MDQKYEKTDFYYLTYINALISLTLPRTKKYFLFIAFLRKSCLNLDLIYLHLLLQPLSQEQSFQLCFSGISTHSEKSSFSDS